VKPANIKAVEDDKLNSTLLKALSSVGSDPYPWQVGEGGEWQYRPAQHEGDADVAGEQPSPQGRTLPEEPVGRGYFDATRAGDSNQRKAQRG
jgi:hypothetical protein